MKRVALISILFAFALWGCQEKVRLTIKVKAPDASVAKTSTASPPVK